MRRGSSKVVAVAFGAAVAACAAAAAPAAATCMTGSGDPSYCTAPSIDTKTTAQSVAFAVTNVSTTAPGDLLVAFARADSPRCAGNTATVSGGGLTWTLAGRENKGLGDSEVWTARATSTLHNAAIREKLHFARYDAALTVIAFKNATGIGASSESYSAAGAPSGSLTTTQPQSWVFAAGNDWAQSLARTPDTGQQLQQQSFDSVGDTYWVQSTSDPTPAAGTTVTINDTAPTGDPFNLVLVEVL
jgi:hypothetical protein